MLDMRYYKMRSASSDNDDVKAEFSIQKRFSITSLVVMLITAGILIFIYRQDSLTQFEKFSADENEKTLLHLAYKAEVPITRYISQNSNSNNPDVESITHMDSVFYSALKELSENGILKLKMYDQSGESDLFLSEE